MATFYALKVATAGLNPVWSGDIGCYSLGLNTGQQDIITHMCKPNTLIKVYKGEGEGAEFVVEFTDTDTGLSEKHRVDLSTAVVIRRYLESRSR